MNYATAKWFSKSGANKKAPPRQERLFVLFKRLPPTKLNGQPAGIPSIFQIEDFQKPALPVHFQ